MSNHTRDTPDDRPNSPEVPSFMQPAYGQPTPGTPADVRPGVAAPPKPELPAVPAPPPSDLNFFGHRVLSKLAGMSSDMALAGLNRAEATSGLPVRMPSRQVAEQQYSDFLKKGGHDYDDNAKYQFNKEYTDAEHAYRDYTQGNFNALNTKSGAENSAYNLNLGIFTNNRLNNTRRNLPKGFDLQPGFTNDDPRSLGSLANDAFQKQGLVESGEFLQSESFEKLGRDQQDADGMVAYYDEQTGGAQRDAKGQIPKFAHGKIDSGGGKEGLTLDIDEFGQVTPVLLTKDNNVYKSQGVLSDWDYGVKGGWESGFQWPLKLAGSMGANVLKVLATAVNSVDYLGRLGGGKNWSNGGWNGTSWDGVDQTMDASGAVNPASLKPWNKATLTDHLVGQQYDDTDSELAKRILLIASGLEPGRAIDERGSSLHSGAAFSAGARDVTAQLLPQLALGFVTGGTSALGYAAVEGFGATNKQFREMGYTPGQSNAAGVVAGAVTAISTKLIEGNWLSRILKGSPAAKELLEQPLVDFVTEATKEVERQAAKEGLQLTEQQLGEEMVKRVPGLVQKYTTHLNSLSQTLEKNALGRAAKKVFSMGGDKPIGIGTSIKGAVLEGLQEGTEEVGNIAEEAVFDKFVFNGKVYDSKDFGHPDQQGPTENSGFVEPIRLRDGTMIPAGGVTVTQAQALAARGLVVNPEQVRRTAQEMLNTQHTSGDNQAWEQRQQQRTLSNMAAQVLESTVMGSVGGVVGELPFVLNTRMREARHAQEKRDLNNALIQYVVENKGQGLDALKEKAREIGRAGRWGTNLTATDLMPRQGVNDSDGKPQTENDYITQGVLNQIELIERLTHESGILKQLDKGNVSVQNAVGTLAQYVNQAELYQRGLLTLLRVNDAEARRNDALKTVLAPPAAASLSGPATDGQSQRIADMSPEQIRAEQVRRLEAAKGIANAEEQAQEVAKINNRYATAQDNTAVGLIARYDDVHAYYEAGRRRLEWQYKIDTADAGDAQGLRNLEQQRDQYEKEQAKAATAITANQANNSELAAVKVLADRQLGLDNVALRARSVYDGNMVQDLTQESFLRRFYQKLYQTAADKNLYDKLPVEERQLLDDQLAALSDNTQGFFDQNQQLKVNGEYLRSLGFRRKRRMGELMEQFQLRQQQQQQTALSVNEFAASSLAELDNPEAGQETALRQHTAGALDLVARMAGGVLNFNPTVAVQLADRLAELAEQRLIPLREAMRHDPSNAADVFLASGIVSGQFAPGSQVGDEDVQDAYREFLDARLSQVQDGAAREAQDAATQLRHAAENLQEYKAPPLPNNEQIELLLATTMDANTGADAEHVENMLDARLKELERQAQDPGKLAASITADDLNNLRGAVVRNLVAAEINHEVGNLLYERQVAGSGVDVQGVVDGAREKKVARAEAEQQAAAAIAAGEAPAPAPSDSQNPVAEEGKDALSRIEDGTVPQDEPTPHTRRDRVQQLVDGLIRNTGTQADEKPSSAQQSIQGNWLQRTLTIAAAVGERVNAQIEQEMDAWTADPANVDATGSDLTNVRERLTRRAVEMVRQQLLDESQQVGITGIALVLARTATSLIQSVSSPEVARNLGLTVGITAIRMQESLDTNAEANVLGVTGVVGAAAGAGIAAAGGGDVAMGAVGGAVGAATGAIGMMAAQTPQVRVHLKKSLAYLKGLLTQKVRETANLVWHWNAPFGETKNLHLQTQGVYEAIYYTSRIQLRRIDVLRRQLAEAMANRGAVDQGKRVAYLQNHAKNLLYQVVHPSAGLFGTDAKYDSQLQLLAQAEGMLTTLYSRKPLTLPEIGDYQVELHQAEELVRQAYAEPQHRQQLAAMLLDEAAKEVAADGRSSKQPATAARMAWNRMLQPEGSATAGSAAVLFALFGANRSLIAKHFDAWLQDAHPLLADPVKNTPTPSLNQQDVITQAVQALTAPWLFADDHILSQASEKAHTIVLRNTALVTGFAGVGKTEMAAAPIAAVYARLAGARSVAQGLAVTATAQHPTQREGITNALNKAGTVLRVESQEVEAVLSSLEALSYPDTLLVIDEATILTAQQSGRLFEGVRKLNENRRDQQQPELKVLLLGDPAQLSGETTDPVTKVSYRLNKNHPITDQAIYPKLAPLTEIYRTGYVILDSIQGEYRKRILSESLTERNDTTPFTGQYMLPDAADYTTARGLQYQDPTAQRQQIADHIQQLEATSSPQTLLVTVSRDDVANEIAALALAGVTNASKYVVAIDKAQGRTVDFTYVAVNERTPDNLPSGNDNLRATLVGLSRSKLYASVRVPSVTMVNNRQETQLAKFQDDEVPERKKERALASEARRVEVRKLSALTATQANPVGPAATVNSTAAPAAKAGSPAASTATSTAQQQAPAPPAAPLNVAPVAVSVSTSTATATAATEATETAADAVEESDATDSQPAADGTDVVGELVQAAVTQTEAQAAADRDAETQQKQVTELSESLQQQREAFNSVALQLPSYVASEAVNSSLEESLDHQTLIEDQGKLLEVTESGEAIALPRVSALSQARAMLNGLWTLLTDAQQIGDPAFVALVQQELDRVQAVIGREARQQLQLQQSMLAVGIEDDASEQARRGVPPISVAAEASGIEREPGVLVGQKILPNGTVEVGQIVMTYPIYEPEAKGGGFKYMKTDVYQPKGADYLQRLNDAQRHIRQEIKNIRASRVIFKRNQVAKLAQQGRVILHSFLAPKQGLQAALWNKSGVLRTIMDAASLSFDGAVSLTTGAFKNYRLQSGVVLRGPEGNGQFYVRHYDRFVHGQPLPNDEEGQFERNIHEVYYEEEVGGVTYEVSVAMIRREKDVQPGRIVRDVSNETALDNLLLASVTAPVALGERLLLEDVKPPVYLDQHEVGPDGEELPLRSVKVFREEMAAHNVGVSRPFVITVSAADDFKQGNYSFYYGELDNEGNALDGGRKMLSGRAAVFTAFGYTAADLSARIQALVDQDLPAADIITELRTKYDAEMVLLENRNTSLLDYSSIVLNETGGQVNTLDQLIARRATAYRPAEAEARRGGMVTRTAGIDQFGRPSQPVRLQIEVMRTFFTANQGRFLNVPKALAGRDKTLQRGGLINKFINLFTGAGLVEFTSEDLKTAQLTEKAKNLLKNANGIVDEELVEHLEKMMGLLGGRDAQRDTTIETDEEGRRKNFYWSASYATDLILFLSYFDGQLNQALSQAWQEEEGNQIQVNPSYAVGGIKSTFSEVVSPGRNTDDVDVPVVDMEEMLETRRTIKTYPSFVLDLNGPANEFGRRSAAPQQQADEGEPGAGGEAPAPAVAGEDMLQARTPDASAPPRTGRRADSEDLGDFGPRRARFLLNEDEITNGNLHARSGQRILEQILGTNPSAWLQRQLDRHPWLRERLRATGLGLAKYWQEGGDYSFEYAFGAVTKGLIQLNAGLNGLWQALTPRHEAMHYVLQLLPPARVNQILGWTREAMRMRGVANAAYASLDEVEEWLTEHYSALFQGEEDEATARAKRWKWLPGPVLRLFYAIRDAAFRLDATDGLGQLDRFLRDMEGGRFRGQRVSFERGLSTPDKLARNEAGLRARRYEVVADLFDGRRNLSRVAAHIERYIYERLSPTRFRNGEVPKPVKNEAEAVQWVADYFYDAAMESVKLGEGLLSFDALPPDNPEHDFAPQERAIARRLFRSVEFRDGIGMEKVENVMAFNAIVGHLMQHVRGQFSINAQGVARLNQSATSSQVAVYDGDGDDDTEQQSEQASELETPAVASDAPEGSAVDGEVAKQVEEATKMGKEFFMADKNRQPRESAELQHHIGMTPYLVRTQDGIYQRLAQPIDKALAFQVLREAAANAATVFDKDPDADVITYDHFAEGLRLIAASSIRERHDVAVSLLARFFDKDRVLDNPTTRYTGRRDGADAFPSLLELGYGSKANRADLDGSPLAEKSRRTLSQVYGFYTSLQRRNMLDANVSGNTKVANDISDGLTDLKNKASSSLINRMFKQVAKTGSWEPRVEVLDSLTNKGFGLLRQGDIVQLVRTHPGTQQTVPIVGFNKPVAAGGKGFAYAEGTTYPSVYEQDPEFFADSVYDVLASLGLDGLTSARQMRSLVSDLGPNGKAAGADKLNQKLGRYLTRLLQPFLTEHILTQDESSHDRGGPALSRLGVNDAVGLFFRNSLFVQQPKDDLNTVMRGGSRVKDLHYSPTMSYNDAIKPLVRLFSASSVRPESLSVYNALGNRVSLISHGNAMYQTLRAVTTGVERVLRRKSAVAPYFNAGAGGYRNGLRNGDYQHTADDVLLAGTIEDSRTGRKHSLVSSSAREFTRVAFENLFLQELQQSNGESVIVLGSAKSDKEKQTLHRLRRAEGSNYPLAVAPGTAEARRMLANVRASYDALLRHQIFPRLLAAGYDARRSENLPLASQLAVAEDWLRQQSPAHLAGLPLFAGVDYEVKGGVVVGISQRVARRVQMSDEAFAQAVEDSLDAEAAQLHADGYTFFPAPENDVPGLAVSTAGFTSNNPDYQLVRRQDAATGGYAYNPLVKSFLLSQFLHRHDVETGMVGADVYFKAGENPEGDGIDYAKRLILLTTDYEAYDLNAFGGLPKQSRVAILRDETLADVLQHGEYAAGEKGRGRSLEGRYSYSEVVNGVEQVHTYPTVSADNGQFYAILEAMAPHESPEDRAAWAREKIEDQALHDGLEKWTMVHDLQSRRSGLQSLDDQTQRKPVQGGLMSDGVPILKKTSAGLKTNELLELSNQYEWNELLQMLGGVGSPLHREWQSIREQLRKKYPDPASWRREVVQGNADWRLLAAAMRDNPQLERWHTGMLTTKKGIKVGIGGTANALDNSYANALRWVDNRYGGIVLGLGQNLTESDIANITQENYIFSLQGLNWQTTQQINDNLARLSNAGLVDMELLIEQMGGKEMFMRRAEEMMDNLGNVSNTNAMFRARLDPNLPLLSTTLGTAIASQVKTKVSKLRFAGARMTVQSSTGRVNLYEVEGKPEAYDQRRLVKEGYATINERGQLVPTGTGAFTVRELAFTHYKHKGTDRKLTAQEAGEFARVVRQAGEGDAGAQVQAAALAEQYEMVPMEVFVSREAFAPFDLPADLDLHEITEQYFQRREFDAAKRRVLKEANAWVEDTALRQQLAETQVGEPLENESPEEHARMVKEEAANYSPEELVAARNIVLGKLLDTEKLAELEAQANDTAADLWQNFQRRTEFKVTRIPVTGLNSIQLAKVVGFYDSQGNTMLMPSQVQTVAGADNDGDMVTVEYYDVRGNGRSFDADQSAENQRENAKGNTRNLLRETKLAAIRNPLNVLQLFHPIDFSPLRDFKKAAIGLDARLPKAGQQFGAGGLGPLGDMYRFAPTVATLIKNQQGKSGVGAMVKGSQLYYQNVAIVKQNASTGFVQKNGQAVGDFPRPIRYGQYVIPSVLGRELQTGNLFENMANGSLDNAKEDLLGWLNVNPQMWGPYTAMMMAQVPEAEIFALLSHPYAVQVAQVSQRSRDVDQRFARSVAEVCRGILTGDKLATVTDEEGNEQVIPTGGMDYDSYRKNRREAEQQNADARSAARAAVLADGGSEEAADLAALSVEDVDVKQVESLKQRVLVRQAMIGSVPDLKGVTERYPKSDHPDHLTRQFVIEQLYLFALRGDELLQAQGVLRAMDGPAPGEFDSLQVLERVLNGLGYSPSNYNGDVDKAVVELKSGLLNDGEQIDFTKTGPDGQPRQIPAVTDAEKQRLVTSVAYELVNPRAHILANPALESAVRALVFDYEQRRHLFISRQPVVVAALRRLMLANRKFFAGGKGGTVLLRELRAWLDSRYLRANPTLRISQAARDQSPALAQLASWKLTDLAEQEQFMEGAADYLYSLKSQTNQDGYGIGSLGLIEALQPRDNEHGRVVTLANSESLTPEEKAVLVSEYEDLGRKYGPQGVAVQQVLFTYALISRGLQVGKGSLAELISPEVARPYSEFLENQRAYFANPDSRARAEQELSEFAREFQLLNPVAAPELRKSKTRTQEGDLLARSFYYDREIALGPEPRVRENKNGKKKIVRDQLPLAFTAEEVLAGNSRYASTAAEDMPRVLAIPNANVSGGFAVYERVFREKVEQVDSIVNHRHVKTPTVVTTFQYERRFSAAIPQLNAYGTDAFSSLPVVPIGLLDAGESVLAALNRPDSPLGQNVAQLHALVKNSPSLSSYLEKGIPATLSNGQPFELAEQMKCVVTGK